MEIKKLVIHDLDQNNSTERLIIQLISKIDELSKLKTITDLFTWKRQMISLLEDYRRKQ